MAIEIERKFLIKKGMDFYKKYNGLNIIQGYISKSEFNIVRVRVIGNEGWITIKGKNNNLSRLEYEYLIPLNDAKEILEKLCDRKIEKKRYIYFENNKKWEIDEFEGDNKGLIVAEIELKDENEEFVLPLWIDKEVSHDYKYSNSNLINYPFIKWVHNKD